jgi:hypothetical protein
VNPKRSIFLRKIVVSYSKKKFSNLLEKMDRAGLFFYGISI